MCTVYAYVFVYDVMCDVHAYCVVLCVCVNVCARAHVAARGPPHPFPHVPVTSLQQMDYMGGAIVHHRHADRHVPRGDWGQKRKTSFPNELRRPLVGGASLPV